MSTPPLTLPKSRLFEAYDLQKKKKLKKECCEKFMKKKGKYCKSCPTIYALCNDARRNF